MADGTFADPRDEVLDDLEVDVSLEEGQAHLAHGGIDIGLADPASTGQVAKRLAQPFAECVEHGPSGAPSGGGPVRRTANPGWCASSDAPSSGSVPQPRDRHYAPRFVRNPFASPLWRNQAFVRVWGAATVSIFGSLITRIALPLVAILVLGSGALEVALIRSLDLGATLLFGLVAGAWVDRLRRRPVLIWADLGRAVLLGSIPVAFALGVLTYWHLLVVSGLAAILWPRRARSCHSDGAMPSSARTSPPLGK